ncbi:hypothetical protein HB852_07200 [Listeria grandensis]|uniref:NAD(P)-binding domain-containing protein n=1 Tax=Listeria grandensis TaxID=1494963 RepID=UPI001624E344|nr:NAD(P)-binding domain-containing protein [Listeria grandensis]MBC1474401.1 hypothetical protein [Listeria grandensis]
MKNVLIVGYGILTKEINVHLKNAGYSTVILSKHREKSGEVINDLREMKISPNIILGCFKNWQDSKKFWFKNSVGILINRNNSICIEMSTLSEEYVQGWYKHIESCRGYGVESPITGSKNGGKQGTLSAFLYYRDGIKNQEIRLFFDSFCKNIYIFSNLSNPTKFKLLYNAWGASILYSLKEFAPMIQSLEADTFLAQTILKSDGWMSLVCSAKLDQVLEGNFDDVHFKLGYMVKDLIYASEWFESNQLLMFELVKNEYVKKCDGKDNFNKDFSIVAGDDSKC